MRAYSFCIDKYAASCTRRRMERSPSFELLRVGYTRLVQTMTSKRVSGSIQVYVPV